MNVLFLSIGEFENLDSGSVHIDLVRCFARKGHNVYVVCKNERRNGCETRLTKVFDLNILRIKTGNLKRSGLFEKGLSTLLVEGQFLRAIKEYLSDIRFDLVLYHTPPVTFEKVVSYIKKRDCAKCYLLLKDIFPQNSVDLGMLSKHGLKGLIYRYFRYKERKLYAISDAIGCMSKANVQYLLKHNPEINQEKVEECPNCAEIRNVDMSRDDKEAIRKKYDIPLDKIILVYGGNIGKPQGVPFIIECLKKCSRLDNIAFLIIGNGTEYGILEEYINHDKPQNVFLKRGIPQREYEKLVSSCDVGLIFLDHRFTIPNFPSRLLSYMQSSLPVIAATDPNTDVGQVIVDGGFGWWCESNDSDIFRQIISQVGCFDVSNCGKKSREYLINHYSINRAYEIITRTIQ